MKLAGWKRTILAGLVTLSVAGAPLATVPAAHAALGDGGSPGPMFPIGSGEGSGLLN
ncbi:MAG: hypothetical protein AB7R89_25900 [Dehalococcoidia bacterium]